MSPKSGDYHLRSTAHLSPPIFRSAARRLRAPRLGRVRSSRDANSLDNVASMAAFMISGAMKVRLRIMRTERSLRACSRAIPAAWTCQGQVLERVSWSIALRFGFALEPRFETGCSGRSWLRSASACRLELVAFGAFCRQSFAASAIVCERLGSWSHNFYAPRSLPVKVRHDPFR